MKKKLSSAKRIALFGAGGHAKVILEIIRHLPSMRVTYLFDDAPSKSGTRLYQVPVGPLNLASAQRVQKSGTRFALGAVASSNALRREKHEALKRAGFKLTVLIDRDARVSMDTVIGEGSVVMAKAVIHPGARIGEGAVINTGAIIEHDCVIGDYVHVAPGAVLGGGVKVGHNTLIGMNACVRQGLEIAANVTIGAGAAVISNVESGKTVLGVPAKS